MLWNGTPLVCLDAVHALDLVEQGWQWQAATKVLTIKLPRTAEATIVHDAESRCSACAQHSDREDSRQLMLGSLHGV